MLGIIQEHRGAESKSEEIYDFLSICLSSSWESKVVFFYKVVNYIVQHSFLFSV